MSKYIYIALASVVLCMFASCNPEAKAVSGTDVKIDIRPNVISSGYMQIEFKTNKEAYYHIGIASMEDAPDTSQAVSVKNFMALQLDRAYADYLYWRALLLWEGASTVAEFATHSLQYGAVEYNFTLLEPDKEYVIFAFAVNAKTNKPDGRLFTFYTRTEPKSVLDNLKFEYRVRGYWDYVYPVYQLNENDVPEVMTWIPWVGATVDSANLVEYAYANPKAYFMETFNEYALYNEKERIHFGIDARNNNGFNTGTSETVFEEGHTYYTGLSLMDGYLSPKDLYIYKFSWKDEQTQFLFTAKDALTTDW